MDYQPMQILKSQISSNLILSWILIFSRRCPRLLRGLPSRTRRVAPPLALAHRMAIQQADHFQPGGPGHCGESRWLDGIWMGFGWDLDVYSLNLTKKYMDN